MTYQPSSNTHDLSLELVQKIAQADLGQAAYLYAVLCEWWDSGNKPSYALRLQQSQLDFLLLKRLDLLHTH